MKNYSLPKDVLDKILTYLGSKPWVEVNILMQEIIEKTKPTDKENG